jgi:SAM-dependent methyltransferase
MNMHHSYLRQAAWTRELRSYLFERAQLAAAERVLDVGCGTGAILIDLSVSEPPARPVNRRLHGIDSSAEAIAECRIGSPGALLTRGDALNMPFPSESFDVTFCHFFLLWARDPTLALSEMKRVTRKGGHLLALAEPDYLSRVDRPDDLVNAGLLQTRSLQEQGAHVALGSQLADLFYQLDIQIREAGPIRTSAQPAPTAIEAEEEWDVLEADLRRLVSEPELQRLRQLDAQARRRGERLLRVPTYFAWGQV